VEGGVGSVVRPTDLLGVWPHQRRIDALAAGIADPRSGAPLVAKRIECVADHLRVLARAQEAEDPDLGRAEPAREALGLAQKKLAGALVATPEALHLTVRPPHIDLDADHHIVLLRHRRAPPPGARCRRTRRSRRAARRPGGADPADLQPAEPGRGRDRLSEAVAALDGRLPKVCEALERAEEDILAFYAFPSDHWKKLRSTNPLKRLNREVGRRTDVVGIFPDDASLIRLTTMLAIEQNDEWLVSRRYLSIEKTKPR
jgi:hypothetical protein